MNFLNLHKKWYSIIPCTQKLKKNLIFLITLSRKIKKLWQLLQLELKMLKKDFFQNYYAGKNKTQGGYK